MTKSNEFIHLAILIYIEENQNHLTFIIYNSYAKLWWISRSRVQVLPVAISKAQQKCNWLRVSHLQ